MTFQTDKYRIEIFVDTLFASESSDNVNTYDLIHFDKADYHYPSVYGIELYDDTRLIKSAVVGSIGGGTSIHKSSAVVDNDRIVVCCANTLFCLSIPTLGLLWHCQADESTCFEVYNYRDSYIVHGEMQISRIDRNGNIMWQRSGADIFTTPEGLDTFIINHDYILATDWEYRKYKFDFDGRRLD